MLFQLNLAAYVSARINYTFIMEIDNRTAIDYRQFLEVGLLSLASREQVLTSLPSFRVDPCSSVCGAVVLHVFFFLSSRRAEHHALCLADRLHRLLGCFLHQPYSDLLPERPLLVTQRDRSRLHPGL